MSIPFSSITPDEAVSHIQDGDFVVLSHAAAVPQACVAALARNYERFHNVRIFHMVTLGESPYTALHTLSLHDALPISFAESDHVEDAYVVEALIVSR